MFDFSEFRPGPHASGYGCTNSGGYHVVRGLVDGLPRPAHRVVWEKTHGPIPDGFHIHHIDGDRQNNAIENLEALSAEEHGRLHHATWYEVDGVLGRDCPTCAEWKPRTKEHWKFQANGEGTKSAHCTPCRNARERERRKKNGAGPSATNPTEEQRERQREARRRWKERNRERVREDNAAYREANREKIRESGRAYYHRKKDEN